MDYFLMMTILRHVQFCLTTAYIDKTNLINAY